MVEWELNQLRIAVITGLILLIGGVGGYFLVGIGYAALSLLGFAFLAKICFVSRWKAKKIWTGGFSFKNFGEG
ncbi:MAG: hypothetical protein JSV05_08990 [Candidatus Bathyarchaeota archaeon]|nr:MAG: hypothetical protein JSV05_08990 [Candidatus Bathyarchaeota archaeon]